MSILDSDWSSVLRMLSVGIAALRRGMVVWVELPPTFQCAHARDLYGTMREASFGSTAVVVFIQRAEVGINSDVSRRQWWAAQAHFQWLSRPFEASSACKIIEISLR